MLTNVVLSHKNFVVEGTVEGQAKNVYILGFGGLLSTNLLGEAKAKMIESANLRGHARAIVNVTYDTHVSCYVLFSKYTVTATGTVIEFRK
ncbi:MAG: hypothetical protein LBL81_02615 [Tannerella sp.]|nr:hypothetical protein [Tannerella sp.]